MTHEEQQNRIKQLEDALRQIQQRNDASDAVLSIASKGLYPEGQLYLCRYEFNFYVTANSPTDARSWLREAIVNETHHPGEVIATPVSPGHEPVGRWDLGSYVYNAKNVPLGYVLSKLK